jgi:hypothetical protein
MPPKKKPPTKEKSVTKTEKSKTKTEKSTTKTEKSTTKNTSTKAPTAYQTFMKDEIKRLKVSHPDLAHKERFSMAAKNWSKQKE